MCPRHRAAELCALHCHPCPQHPPPSLAECLWADITLWVGTAPAQPHKQPLPQPSCPTVDSSPWAASLTRGCSCRGIHGLCLLQASSTAAQWAPPWLHMEICSMWCPWAVGGQLAPLWASSCLEHLLPSSCTASGGCRLPNFNHTKF